MHEPRKSDEFLETGGDLAEKPQNVQIEEKTLIQPQIVNYKVN